MSGFAAKLLLLLSLYIGGGVSILKQTKSLTTPELEFPCEPPHHHTYNFCDKSLPLTTRAHSLISLLTLHEKVQQLSNTASAVPRLGLPPYQWWSESLHGIAINGPGINFTKGPIFAATAFPQVILTASSFNRTLWFSIASALAVEARAMYNVGQAGLTFWAPNVNIFRDPRWGRGQETPGEDPMLSSAYAVEFVRGFQGADRVTGGGLGPVGNAGDRIGENRSMLADVSGDDDQLMLSACCKHVTAYDLENWGNFSRYSFNAVVRLLSPSAFWSFQLLFWVWVLWMLIV